MFLASMIGILVASSLVQTDSTDATDMENVSAYNQTRISPAVDSSSFRKAVVGFVGSRGQKKLGLPPSKYAQSCFDVLTTLSTSKQRCINVSKQLRNVQVFEYSIYTESHNCITNFFLTL